MVQAMIQTENNYTILTVEKINKPTYLNLAERMEAFYKRPIDEIYVESTQEVDVGNPKSNEIW